MEQLWKLVGLVINATKQYTNDAICSLSIQKKAITSTNPLFIPLMMHVAAHQGSR